MVIAARRFDKLFDTYGTTGIDGVRRPQYLPNTMHAYGLRAIDFTLRDDEYLPMSHPDIIEDSYTISETAAKAVLPAQKDGEFVDGVNLHTVRKLQALLRGQTQHLEKDEMLIDIKYYTNHDNIFSSKKEATDVIFFTRADLTNQRKVMIDVITRAAVFARYGREGDHDPLQRFNDIVEDSGTVCSYTTKEGVDNPDPTIHFTGADVNYHDYSGVSGARASMVGGHMKSAVPLRMKTPVELMSSVADREVNISLSLK
ncbi:hypothetical protein SPFM20_00260 [Salmonella phage SPFM20]|nr:hypothetical protein SPFM8_00259 [Salmonella phage SPFM8]VFR14938.1 hypothetical protein SPFM20_00260 [Salmonella phage SPFM20]